MTGSKCGLRRTSMSELEPTVRLGEEQIAFYHENGFLAIEAITTAAEVELLRGVYDRLFEARAGREEGAQFDLAGTDEEDGEASLPQILSPVKYAPELADTLFRANARAISRQLLGPETSDRFEHAILKPPFHGAPTPWHQDEAYWNPDYCHTALSVWMPLQEATIENGCMQFIPGSHRFEVLPHHCINHDPRIHGLEVDKGIDLSGAVACPLPAGGATFHHNRTLHYAGPNHSPIPRRAYILTFGLPATPYLTERVFYWNDEKTSARDERARRAALAAS
jgi:ectoine hydroxylase-related dioxygenase (phytanoyl-CoA dioxygenase family)